MTVHLLMMTIPFICEPRPQRQCSKTEKGLKAGVIMTKRHYFQGKNESIFQQMYARTRFQSYSETLSETVKLL